MPSHFIVQLFLLAIFVDASLAIQCISSNKLFRVHFSVLLYSTLVLVVNYRKFFPSLSPFGDGVGRIIAIY